VATQILKGIRMMKKQQQSMKKRMVLTTVAAVTLMMMSFAAPAMAQEVQKEEEAQRDGSNSSSGSSGIVDEQPYKDPGIRPCDFTPTECETSTDPADDIITLDLIENPALQQPVNKEDPDIITLDPIENPKTGITPIEEEASAPGDVKTEVIPPGTTPSAPEKDDATSALKPANGSESPLVTGCPYEGYEYDEDIGTCFPTLETYDFASVIGGALGGTNGKPWPDSAGEYAHFVGGLSGDFLTSLGIGPQLGGAATEAALVSFGEELGPGPIGWGIQGAGYVAGFGGELGGVLMLGVAEVGDLVNDVLSEVTDGIADAAGDVWDEITSWW
jgi:hypothetical protein